jgi:hypothetical protein
MTWSSAHGVRVRIEAAVALQSPQDSSSESHHLGTSSDEVASTGPGLIDRENSATINS